MSGPSPLSAFPSPSGDTPDQLDRLLHLTKQLKNVLPQGTEKTLQLRTTLCELLDDLRSLSNIAQGGQLSCTPRLVVTGADSAEMRSAVQFMFYSHGVPPVERRAAGGVEQVGLESPVLGISRSTDSLPLGVPAPMLAASNHSEVLQHLSPTDSFLLSEDTPRLSSLVERSAAFRRPSVDPAILGVEGDTARPRGCPVGVPSAVTFALHETAGQSPKAMRGRDGPCVPGVGHGGSIMMTKQQPSEGVVLPPLPQPPETPTRRLGGRVATSTQFHCIPQLTTVDSVGSPVALRPHSMLAPLLEITPLPSSPKTVLQSTSARLPPTLPLFRPRLGLGSDQLLLRPPSLHGIGVSPSSVPVREETRGLLTEAIVGTTSTSRGSPFVRRTATMRPGTFRTTLADRVHALLDPSSASMTSSQKKSVNVSGGGLSDGSGPPGHSATTVEAKEDNQMNPSQLTNLGGLLNTVRGNSFRPCLGGNLTVSWMLQEIGEHVIRQDTAVGALDGATTCVPLSTLGDAYCVCLSSRDVGRPALEEAMQFLFGPFMPEPSGHPAMSAGYRGSPDDPFHEESGEPTSTMAKSAAGPLSYEDEAALRVRRSLASSAFFVLTGTESLTENKDRPRDTAASLLPPPIAHSLSDLVSRFRRQMKELFGVDVRPWQVIPFNGVEVLLTRDLLLALCPHHDSQSMASDPPANDGAAAALATPSTVVAEVLSFHPCHEDPLSTAAASLTVREAVARYCASVFGKSYWDRMITADNHVDESELQYIVAMHAVTSTWGRSGAAQLCKTFDRFEHFAFSYVLSQAALSLMMSAVQLLVRLPSAAEAARRHVSNLRDRLEVSQHRQIKLLGNIGVLKAHSPHLYLIRLRECLQAHFSTLVSRFLRDLRIMVVLQESPREINVHATGELSVAYERLRSVIRHFKTYYSEKHWEQAYNALRNRIAKVQAEHKHRVAHYMAAYPAAENCPLPQLNQQTLLCGSTAPLRSPRHGGVEELSPDDKRRIAQSVDPNYASRLQKLLAKRLIHEKQLVIQLSQMNTEVINFFTAVCVSEAPNLAAALQSETYAIAKEYEGLLKGFMRTRPSVNAVPLAALRAMISKLATHTHVVTLQGKPIVQRFIVALRATLCEDQVRALARFRLVRDVHWGSSAREGSLGGMDSSDSLPVSTDATASPPPHRPRAAAVRSSAPLLRRLCTAEDFFVATPVTLPHTLVAATHCMTHERAATTEFTGDSDAIGDGSGEPSHHESITASAMPTTTFVLASRTAAFLTNNRYSTNCLRYPTGFLVEMRCDTPAPPGAEDGTGNECDDPFFLADAEAVEAAMLFTDLSRSAVEEQCVSAAAGTDGPHPPDSSSPSSKTAASFDHSMEKDGRDSAWMHRLAQWRLDTAPQVRPLYFAEQPALWIMLDVLDEAFLASRYVPWVTPASETQTVELLNGLASELLSSHDTWLRRVVTLTDEFKGQLADAEREALWLQSSTTSATTDAMDSQSAQSHILSILQEVEAVSDGLDAIRAASMQEELTPYVED